MSTPLTKPGEYVHVSRLAATCIATLPNTAMASEISMNLNFEWRLTSHAPRQVSPSANVLQAMNSALLNRIASVRSAQNGKPPAARYSSVR